MHYGSEDAVVSSPRARTGAEEIALWRSPATCLGRVFTAEIKRASLRRLRAVVLLGGAVRPTALRTAIGRSVLDLPVQPGLTLLDRWLENCVELDKGLGDSGLAVRLVIDRSSAAPAQSPSEHGVRFDVERDPVEYRGTGGLIADLARQYDPSDYLLIGNAAQILRSSLPRLAAEMSSDEADVTVVSHADGTPSGLMLARCGAFADVPPVGFVDLKEQALPAIARAHRVEVIEHQHPSGLTIRTLSDYIDALRKDREEVDGRAYPDDWEPAFSLIEDGATVHPTARIHDSVVLRGGRVEQGAVVVRSVVCPGGLVKRGAMAVNSLVTGKGSA